jgi:hypothetical protein
VVLLFKEIIMCIITGLIAGITTAATAIGGALSTAGAAIGGVLGSVGSAIGGAASAVGGAALNAAANVGFGMIGAVGGSSAIAAAPTALGVGLGALTIAGGVAAVGMGAAGIYSTYKSARASAKAQTDYQNAVQKVLSEENDTTATISKTATGLQDNSRLKRTLSSLRVPLAALNSNKTNQQAIQNVYGVDSNNVADSTKNMMGLNIAA